MRAVRPFLATASACSLVLLTLAGCGPVEDSEVSDTVDEYIHAREVGDAAAVCAIYSEGFRIDQGLKTDCADKLAQRFEAEPDPTSTEIVEVKVSGEGEARVDLDVSAGGGPSRVVLGLIEKDGGWRIAVIN